MTTQNPQNLVMVCIPVYNDWDAVARLIASIDAAVDASFILNFLLVNDGSAMPPPAALTSAPRQNPGSVAILNLRRNLGHQRAVATGLCYIHDHHPCCGVLVMDGDGEDTAAGVVALLAGFARFQRERAVFALRGKRLEGWVFQSLYKLFKALHWVLIGRANTVGNFSIIPFRQLRSIVTVPELWNHYAASVFKANLPREGVRIDRGSRLAGKSRMNFSGLAIHGLSSIAVFSETVCIRLLIAACLVGVISTAALVAIVVVRFATHLAIPGWATVAAGMALTTFLQSLLLSVIFAVLILHNRSSMNCIPIRDYHHFIADES